ncbi:hypothetical protein GEMRC1_007644 [Eukaryota sp. GEM-RC1]
MRPSQPVRRTAVSGSTSLSFLPLETTESSLQSFATQRQQNHKFRRSVDLSARSSMSSASLDSTGSNSPPSQPLTPLSPSPTRSLEQYETHVDILESCPKCSRNFKSDRISKHISVCQGTKPSSKQKPSPSSSQSSNPKPKKWELRSQQLRNMIRANKGLPPDPNAVPVPETELTTCPHCTRKFSEAAADRHIAICKNVISKPKPPSKNVSRLSDDPYFAARSSLCLKSPVKPVDKPIERRTIRGPTRSAPVTSPAVSKEFKNLNVSSLGKTSRGKEASFVLNVEKSSTFTVQSFVLSVELEDM